MTIRRLIERHVQKRCRGPADHGRLGPLRDVATELGATSNQVVLAWMLGGDPPIIPVLGVSTVDQLDEGLRSADVELAPEQRVRLDT